MEIKMNFKAVEMRKPDAQDFHHIAEGEVYQVKKGDMIIIKDADDTRRFQFAEDTTLNGPIDIIKEKAMSKTTRICYTALILILVVGFGPMMYLFDVLDAKEAYKAFAFGVIVSIFPLSALISLPVSMTAKEHRISRAEGTLP